VITLETAFIRIVISGCPPLAVAVIAAGICYGTYKLIEENS